GEQGRTFASVPSSLRRSEPSSYAPVDRGNVRTAPFRGIGQQYGHKLSSRASQPPSALWTLCSLGALSSPSVATLVTRLPQPNIKCLAVINTSRPQGGAVAIVAPIDRSGRDLSMAFHKRN